MTAALSSLSPLVDAPRAELARLCRAICIERERNGEAARSFDEDFQRALFDVQSRFGATSVSEDDLAETVAQETDRVADAAVLTELLLPKLLSAIRSKIPAASPAPSPAVPASAPLSEKVDTSSSAPSSPLGIADLLEGMLDQQRSEIRSRNTRTRS